MRWAVGAILATLAVTGCVPPREAWYLADFYVSPYGNDAWTGRLPAPNYSGTDGPFATVGRARDALRTVSRPRHTMLGRFVVLIRGGTYPLDGPIVFTPQDSGSASAPIVYAAYPRESPVFTGARPVSNWSQGQDGTWTAKLPRFAPAARPPATVGPPRGREWAFHQLWIADERRTRARHPNTGTLLTDGPLPQFAEPQQHRDKAAAKLGFRFKAGDLRQWPGLDEANLVVYHAWTASRHWIKALDPEKRVVTLRTPSAWPFGYWEREQRYYAENYREALDAPGEWFFDRKTQTLHYKPLPGESPNATAAWVPVTTELVRFDGDPAAGRMVHHITLRGLNFRHADWELDRNQPADGQAAAFLDSAAIVATAAQHCAIEYCEVAHVGTYGIWLRAGSKDNRIVHCHVHDLGAGGIRIGETESPRYDAHAAVRNTVDNCFVHDGGHVFPSGVGVWIGRSSHNTVRRCEIANFDHTGVSVGWAWGYATSTAHHNLIEQNHIHHVGRGVLSDLAGVYTLGVSPGTVIRGNHIHDVHAHKYGGWGIYTDEGSSQITIEGNIVHNTTHGGYHQHYGRDNVVRHNLFAFSRAAQIVRTRDEPHLAMTFTHNIVYCDHDAVLGGNWASGNVRFDYNIYWVTSGAPPDFAGRSFPQWQASGQDLHSLLADPRLANAPQGDFRLGLGSPARSIGYRDLGAAQAGLYGEAYWVNAPRHIATAPALPGIERPAAVLDDFETTPPGAPPAGATVSGAKGGASAAVSEETAAGGRRSLKIVDAAGLAQPSDPQVSYDPRHSEGTVRLAFDLRLEAGAQLWHEWRTQAAHYQAGPSIRFGPNGQVVAGGKLLATLPAGQWCHVEIVCPLGAAAAGRYDLTVGVPGRTQRFAGLPCASPSFDRLRWLGFMSMAAEPAVLYLDNLRLERMH